MMDDFQLINIQNSENMSQHKNSTLDAIQEDINVANLPITELTKLRDDILSSNNNYLRKINDLEQLRVLQRPNYISEIHILDQQLTAMQIDISKKVEKYQDLIRFNSTNRKLLVSEQRGLNITPNPSVVGSPSAKKRKLFERNETESEFSNIITVSSTSDIEIREVCPDGRFVKLYNKGSKEFALRGYELVRTIAEQNVSTVFKFHGSVNLEAGNWLTVWSSTASNQIHKHSAGSIIMNIQAWVVGDLMATILLNPEGQEVATHGLKKRTGFSFTSQ
ncbi:lamin Dm0-like isoform X2 [Acyrthosiphon pisum]|uniref:LTD domain-containing protein n=1 Tax=Acyrthosiphon pisum TaxID=7029 RepID=A0A8R2B737_ACYPI|nr:lamin Dm0-like isoform X2 [Acyrthosiphon pisum]|eukprot:XP_008184498.1 PREDICTED: lamin Dm0-like isoform X2 [Acyrthosiphon pisum]